jgi:hypothetical protein
MFKLVPCSRLRISRPAGRLAEIYRRQAPQAHNVLIEKTLLVIFGMQHQTRPAPAAPSRPPGLSKQFIPPTRSEIQTLGP